MHKALEGLMDTILKTPSLGVYLHDIGYVFDQHYALLNGMEGDTEAVNMTNYMSRLEDLSAHSEGEFKGIKVGPRVELFKEGRALAKTLLSELTPHQLDIWKNAVHTQAIKKHRMDRSMMPSIELSDMDELINTNEDVSTYLDDAESLHFEESSDGKHRLVKYSEMLDPIYSDGERENGDQVEHIAAFERGREIVRNMELRMSDDTLIQWHKKMEVWPV